MKWSGMEELWQLLRRIVVVDIGGSHIGATVPVLGPGGTPEIDESKIRTVPFPRFGTYGEVTETLNRVIERALSARAIEEYSPVPMSKTPLLIAVSTPGPIDSVTQTIWNTPNVVPLRGYPLGATIRQSWNVEKIFHMNDGNAHTNGVRDMPIAAGILEAWVISLGSGVGTGFWTNGLLVEGAHGNAAEGGHFPFRRMEGDPLLPCGCRNYGCVEAYLGVDCVCAHIHNVLRDKPHLETVLRSATELNGEVIFQAAAMKDAFALDIVDMMARALANLIDTMCKVSNPEMIFLCGGLARSGEELKKRVEPLLKKEAMDHCFLPKEIEVVVTPQITAYRGLLKRVLESVGYTP